MAISKPKKVARAPRAKAAPTTAQSRFTEAESERHSAIQALASKYFSCDLNGGWIACVGRATSEIDTRG